MDPAECAAVGKPKIRNLTRYRSSQRVLYKSVLGLDNRKEGRSIERQQVETLQNEKQRNPILFPSNSIRGIVIGTKPACVKRCGPKGSGRLIKENPINKTKWLIIPETSDELPMLKTYT